MYEGDILLIVIRRRKLLRYASIGIILIFTAVIGGNLIKGPATLYAINQENEKRYIKWVDFTVPHTLLKETLNLDVKSYGKEVKLNWIELLAYSENIGNFKRYKKADLEAVVKRLNEGQTMEQIAGDMKYYDYYLEAYTAVLGGFVGEYEIQVDDPDNPGKKKYVKKYGLKAFSPIAKGYSFGHYDDFGDSRPMLQEKTSWQRFARIGGNPIIAVKWKIEVMGWNRYGGWRGTGASTEPGITIMPI